MATGRRAHNADTLRIQAIAGSFAADGFYGPLQILPGSCMLSQALRTRGAVFHCHDGHPLLVEVTPYRGDFKSVRVVFGVSASGIYNLDGRSLALLGEMPFQVGHALLLLPVWHLPFRP